MVRTVRLMRNGNSWAVGVPRGIVRALGWRKGDLLAVGDQAGRLLVRRLDEEQLLEGRRQAAAVALASRAAK